MPTMAPEMRTVGSLEGPDIGVIVVYGVVVIGFGLWVSSDHQFSHHH